MQKTSTPVRLVLGLLLGALGASAGLARPAAASEASPFGVNIHIPQGTELTTILDRAQAAGIGWVRIDFIWAAVETLPNHYDWAAYDALAQAARARGIEVYATLAYTPAWATVGPEISGVPNRPQDWSEFCGEAARRYRGSIRYWGVWNEPNLPRFWAGTREQYLDIILKPCADAIHAAAPEAKVGGPDLAHLTAGSSDWYDWLRESLLQAGSRLDFVTHHLYDTDGSSDVTDKLEGSTLFGERPSFWNAVPPSVEEVLRYTNSLDKPFWLTETGWETSEVGEARQASYSAGLLTDWLTGLPERDWVDKIFFYEMKDPPGDEFSWGLLRANGTTKPVYGAIRDFITASQPSTRDAAGLRHLPRADGDGPEAGHPGARAQHRHHRLDPCRRLRPRRLERQRSVRRGRHPAPPGAWRVGGAGAGEDLRLHPQAPAVPGSYETVGG